MLAGVRELIGDRAVVDGDAVARPAEEAASVADLEQVGDHVDRDEGHGDDRKAPERDVVFERKHLEEARPSGERRSLSAPGATADVSVREAGRVGYARAASGPRPASG